MTTPMVTPKPAPSLGIPSSPNTTTVRIIDSTTRVGLDTNFMVVPNIKGHDRVSIPAYSFLITHSPSNKHILFDLGVRKDWKNMSPVITSRIPAINAEIFVEKNVAEILDAAAASSSTSQGKDRLPSAKDIDAVLWSHHHWDHTGDVSTFPSSTALVVGPGFKDAHTPGYPTNPESPNNESDWAGREFREIDITKEGKGLKFGDFAAFDYFGDGSFYLLDTPGHTVGHMCGLARVSTSPDAFVFMGGDAAHHGGEFRPTEYLPLPSSVIVPRSGKYASRSAPCPGSLLQDKVHPKHSATEPFYEPKSGFNADAEVAKQTIDKIQGFDANDNVLIVIAHDSSLLDEMPLFPKTINGWLAEGLEDRTRWAFLGDFKEAIDSA